TTCLAKLLLSIAPPVFPYTTLFRSNDGTLMSKDYTLKYPILTVACGPTNSLRGASYLSDNKNAMIVDVGGTTTDIGMLVKGFPRDRKSTRLISSHVSISYAVFCLKK